MLFESCHTNCLLFFGFSIVLWNGTEKLILGYKDGLPVAQTKQGLARGHRWTSRGGRYFNVFRGIPYAKIPMGERRFKPPEPLDAEDDWEDTKDFNWEMPVCYQVDMFTGFHIGKEDCLKLNVFTPVLTSEPLLPVMVWIHGGGFVVGDSGTAIWGPHYFMDQDVVLVTLHYRLGPLGFLSLGNEEIAGNQGLWDQRMALQWVKRNIKQFGGDPRKVTIFGESAGSIAVNFHLLSPQSKGLFSKAIMQSGTIFSTFMMSDKHPAQDGHKFVEAVGCSNETVKCLQSVSLKTLFANLLMFDKDCPLLDFLGVSFLGPWKPGVDTFAKKPFLPKDPVDILKNMKDNNIPTIVGFIQHDGLFATTRFIKDPHIYQHFIENQEVCGPIYFLGKEKEHTTEIDIGKSERLIKSYSKNGTKTTFAEYTYLFTDAVAGVGSHRLSNYLVKNNQEVYKYIFSYQGSKFSWGDFFSDSLLQKAFNIILGFFNRYPTKGLGACHVDDLLYLFRMTAVVDMIPSDSDRKVSEDLVKMWVNFAKSGNPNNEGENAWRKADLDNEFDYFMIDESSRMETRKELTRFLKWIYV